MSSPIKRCEHIKINGIQCGSPAMRQYRFCYFHRGWGSETVPLNSSQKPCSFSLPVLEDATAIQIAVMQVMRYIISGDLDSKKAGLLLYALQTASSNLRSIRRPLIGESILDPADAENFVLGEFNRWTRQIPDDVQAEPETVSLEGVAEEPTFDKKAFRQMVFRMLLEVLPPAQHKIS
jgi:hypothetical protein